MLTWHERRDARLPDEFPAEGARWNDLGALAQRYYARFSSETWDELRDQLDAVHTEILDLVRARSDAELYGETWYGKWTMGRMISFNTSSPYANARRRIRAWLRTI